MLGAKTLSAPSIPEPGHVGASTSRGGNLKTRSSGKLSSIAISVTSGKLARGNDVRSSKAKKSRRDVEADNLDIANLSAKKLLDAMRAEVHLVLRRQKGREQNRFHPGSENNHHQPVPHLWRAFAARARSLLTSMEPRDLARMANTFAQAQVLDDELFRDIGRSARRSFLASREFLKQSSTENGSSACLITGEINSDTPVWEGPDVGMLLNAFARCGVRDIALQSNFLRPRPFFLFQTFFCGPRRWFFFMKRKFALRENKKEKQESFASPSTPNISIIGRCSGTSSSFFARVAVGILHGATSLQHRERVREVTSERRTAFLGSGRRNCAESRYLHPAGPRKRVSCVRQTEFRARAVLVFVRKIGGASSEFTTNIF